MTITYTCSTVLNRLPENNTMSVEAVIAVTVLLFVATICAYFLKREYINLYNFYETLKEHVFISVILYIISVIMSYYLAWAIMPMVMHITNPFVCISYIYLFLIFYILYFICKFTGVRYSYM